MVAATYALFQVRTDIGSMMGALEEFFLSFGVGDYPGPARRARPVTRLRAQAV
jgi:hypothetical protein